MRKQGAIFAVVKLNIMRIVLVALVFFAAQLEAQTYWQQQVDYKMELRMDAKKHQFEGKQQLKYTNNSPDTLKKLFYHLYFNAFQPGSTMDMRSQNIVDPDPRVYKRIGKLSKADRGELHAKTLTMAGRNLTFKEEGTILEVELEEAILPGKTVLLDMEFEGQVPVQIRRSGRDNEEGIDYSMAQWYPKLCEYDKKGWHPNPYVGREFYGVWGNFDVKIEMPSNYVLAAGGVLQNPNEVQHGYESGTVNKGTADKLTWHFKAENVHDFVWAADPNYVVKSAAAETGTLLYFVYQPGEETASWNDLPKIMSRVFGIAAQRFGAYPYANYSFIQGGDGGMEYPMATLITGHRPINSLVGVSVHELMHAWYYGMLGTNESLFSWMDEGFTSYASELIMNELRKEKRITGNVADNPMLDDVNGYINYALSGNEEPLSTHSDHFERNQAFGQSSYTKGSVTLVQLEYIVGPAAMERIMLRYYHDWRFKHPTADDFFVVAEKESGMVLDWFQEYWVSTTKQIDYHISQVEKDGRRTEVEIQRDNLFPMPLDVLVTYTDGSEELFYIPLDLMRAEKPAESKVERTVLPDWPWTNPSYTFEIPVKLKKIKQIEIDASKRLADVDRSENIWVVKP